MIRRWFPAVALGMATFLVGWARAGDESYWLDEAATEVFIRRPFLDVLELVLRFEGGLGPYYISLWFWEIAFPTDTGLRMFSVLGGAVAVGLIVAVATRWFDRSTAVLAGLLLATNPMFLRYLTELRAYSWIMVIAIGFGWSVALFLEDPTRRRAVAVGLLVGVGVALHLTFAFWVVALLALAVGGRLVRREHVADLAVAVVVAVAVVMPFLPAIVLNRGQIDWIPATTPRVAFRSGRRLLGGGFLAATLLGLLGAALCVWWRDRNLWSDRVRIRVFVIVSLTMLGPALLLAASMLKPLTIPRYYIAALPWVVLAAAIAARELPKRLPQQFLYALPLALGSVVLANFVASGPLADTDRGSDPRAAVEYVVRRVGRDDVVIIDSPSAPILKYLGARPDIDPAFVGLTPRGAKNYPRRPLTEALSAATEAPTTYIFLFNDRRSADTSAWLAGRTSERIAFGAVSVLVVR